MPITVTIADDIANQYKSYVSQFPKIVELGTRALQARSESGYAGFNCVLEKLAVLPSPEEVLALRPSAALHERIEILLEKKRTVGLSGDDQREWDQYEYLEHLVRMAKGNALCKLKDNKIP